MTLWLRKIGWCSRARRLQNRRDIGQLITVPDECGCEVVGPYRSTLMDIKIPPADENPSEADVHFLEDNINQYNVETTKIGDGTQLSSAGQSCGKMDHGRQTADSDSLVR